MEGTVVTDSFCSVMVSQVLLYVTYLCLTWYCIILTFERKEGMMPAILFCKWKGPMILTILCMSILIAYGTAYLSFMLRATLALMWPTEGLFSLTDSGLHIHVV